MSGRNWRVVLLLALSVLGCATSGCKSKPPFQLDGIDVLPPVEELKEFSLGQYQIPISIVDDRNQAKLTRHNRFQFDFTLFALVSPKEKSQIEDAWETARRPDSRSSDQRLPQRDARRIAGTRIRDAQGSADRRARGQARREAATTTRV